MTGPAALPWDVDEVAIAALDILRLDPTDEDAARILSAATSATELVDVYLDFETAPDSIPTPVFDSAVNLTVEQYRRKDAPFGVTDSWGLDGASIRLSSDVMKGQSSTLDPYKSRWGIA